MECAYKKRVKVLDRILAPVSPKKRVLWADYRNSAGQYFNKPVTAWHSPGAGMGRLLAGVRGALARQGYTLAALWELPPAGGRVLLWKEGDGDGL